MSDEPQAKKIIIDEDWKSRVEAEREAAKKQSRNHHNPLGGPETTEAGNSLGTGSKKPPEPEEPTQPAAEPEDVPLPAPDLLFLCSTMYMQALVSLGLLASPASGQTKIHIHQAKHAIDTLEMLREKTEGNRTADETAAIDNMLHELRLAFIHVQQTTADKSSTAEKG